MSTSIQKENHISNQYVDFILVRHGETKWNEKAPIQLSNGEIVQGPLTQGSSDILLNSNVLGQAEEVAKKLAHSKLTFASLYTSPFKKGKRNS